MLEVTVSKQYRNAISQLYKDHLEKRITEQELSRHLDRMNEEEARRQKHLGHSLIRQALENVEKDISAEQREAFEAKVQQVRGKRERAKRERRTKNAGN